jgi:CMP/dCMP kinase
MITVVAIDGPSGSGKSTIARQVSERLDFPYLDTGAMYRAVGLVAMQKEVAFEDAPGLVKIAAEVKLQMLDERTDGKLVPRVVANGVDITADIRTPACSQAASSIAVHPEVRERLVRRQRNWVKERNGGVVEGRDIGSVVFPDAALKVYLTANDEERAKRRQDDKLATGYSELSAEAAKAELLRRDLRDSERTASPLAVVSDSYVIDTTNKEIEDVVIDVLGELRKRCGGELPVIATQK